MTQDELVTRVERLEAIIGTIALVVNDIQTHDGPKIENLADMQDQVWMNTTYCFDLARRLEYICQATLGYADKADPDLVLKSIRQYRGVHDTKKGGSGSWEEAAKVGEGYMIDNYLENDRRGYHDKQRELTGESTKE